MTILDKILQHKQKEINAIKDQVNINILQDKALNSQPGISLFNALKNCSNNAIIAEIKKQSPSMGNIKPNVNVEELSKSYELNGVVAISVLTDQNYFGGSIDDLIKVKKSISLPVMRKDFIIDPIQIYEAKNAGSDIVLLIAAAMDFNQLEKLYKIALELKMSPLIEIHDKIELDSVMKLNPEVVGINNRNLHSMTVDIQHSVNIRKKIHDDILVISESGIKTNEDINMLKNEGINGFLIGTTLMKSEDPGAILKKLVSFDNNI